MEQFHLSIGVRDPDESARFFEDILGATVSHRDPSGYINILAFGHQITLQNCPDIAVTLPGLHFGFNLTPELFDATAEKVLAAGRQYVTMEPKVVDAGTALERKKMYLSSPSGYAIELKGVKALASKGTHHDQV